jgi:hypothetical protein
MAVIISGCGGGDETTPATAQTGGGDSQTGTKPKELGGTGDRQGVWHTR